MLITTDNAILISPEIMPHTPKPTAAGNKFVTKLIAPSFIEEQKRSNGKIFGSYGGGQGHEKCYHTNLPQAKYPHVFLLDTECLSEEIETCEHADTCKRVGTREIPSDILSDASP